MTGGIATRSAKKRALSADVPTSATYGGSSSGSLLRTAVNAGCDAVTGSDRRSRLAAFQGERPNYSNCDDEVARHTRHNSIYPPLMQKPCQNQPCGGSRQVIESKNVLDEDGRGVRDRCRRFR